MQLLAVEPALFVYGDLDLVGVAAVFGQGHELWPMARGGPARTVRRQRRRASLLRVTSGMWRRKGDASTARWIRCLTARWWKKCGIFVLAGGEITFAHSNGAVFASDGTAGRKPVAEGTGLSRTCTCTFVQKKHPGTAPRPPGSQRALLRKLDH